MKPYNERLPMIDAAIEELGGEFPTEYNNPCLLQWRTSGRYCTGTNNYNSGETLFICTREEFNQRAKELGYINGYEYGVEYEANGEKPDLPDDVKLYINFIGDGMYMSSGEITLWGSVKSFRIVDLRYKPKEQDMNDLPPIGSRVDIIEDEGLMYGHGETDCEVVGHFQGSAIVRMSYGLGCFHAHVLKPNRTETDKLVEQIADELRGCELSLTGEQLKIISKHLIEQGYRKIKPMSEDEFVKSSLKWFGSKRFEVSQLKLVCESLRKLHKAGCRFLDQGE